mgnify:CR=1 FL=1
MREYLDFFDELTGGSFFAEVIERRDSSSVAFRGSLGQGNIPSGGGGWDLMYEEERVTTYSGLVRALRESIASYVAEVIESARTLRRMPEVIDVYEVTGEYDIIATARTNDFTDSGP